MAETNVIPAPYVSFGVFKTTIEKLAETVVPTGALDRRVLDWLSGADYGALMSALRFLGLADDQKRATAEYRELVASSRDVRAFKEKLLAIIMAKYSPIVGNMDLDHGTASELEKKFKDYGVPSGQMLTKTIRFFIKAFQECGMQLSPYITKPKPRTPRIAPAKAQNGKKREDDGTGLGGNEHKAHPPVFDAAPFGFERMPIPGVANGFIQYPTNLTETQWSMFSAAVTMLKAYADVMKAGGKGKNQ